MRVFISWSGHRSRLLAEALGSWLPMVFQAVSPWLSASDIHPGTRWARELEAALDEIDFGVLCLTRENLLAPWVLFEAGALSKSVKTGRVVPYLLDLVIDSLPAPLSQFQAIPADKAGTRRLLQTIADASPENLRPGPILDEAFETFWPRLRDRVRNARSSVDNVERVGDSWELATVSLAAAERARVQKHDALQVKNLTEAIQQLRAGGYGWEAAENFLKLAEVHRAQDRQRERLGCVVSAAEEYKLARATWESAEAYKDVANLHLDGADLAGAGKFATLAKEQYLLGGYREEARMCGRWIAALSRQSSSGRGKQSLKDRSRR